MTININEDITKETVDKITQAINELQPNDKLFIYFSSEGGDVNSAEAIIHMINNNADIIEVVGYGELLSCGFDIFFKVICYKMLLPNTVGMCHQSNVKININESTKPYEERGVADKAWLKLQKDQTIKFCNSLGMTDKEITAIKKGKDVYFQYKRMQDFLKTQQS